MMDENGIHPEQSVRQRRFFAALLSAVSVREAARQVGVGETTAWRYMRIPAVRSAIAARQASILGQVSHRLSVEMSAALDTLGSIVRDVQVAPGTRVSAARVILESGLRMAEMVTLTERVTALEERMGEE